MSKTMRRAVTADRAGYRACIARRSDEWNLAQAERADEAADAALFQSEMDSLSEDFLTYPLPVFGAADPVGEAQVAYLNIDGQNVWRFDD